MSAIDELKNHIKVIDGIHNNEILITLKCCASNKISVSKLLKIIETIEFIENYIKEFGITPKTEVLKYGKYINNNTWGFSYTEFLKRIGIKKTIKCTKCGLIEESSRVDKRVCNSCKKGSKRLKNKEYQRKSRAQLIELKDELRKYKDSEFHNAFNFGSKS